MVCGSDLRGVKGEAAGVFEVEELAVVGGVVADLRGAQGIWLGFEELEAGF